MNPFNALPGTGRMLDQLVILDMKHGVEAKNYEEVCPLSAAGTSELLPSNHMMLCLDLGLAIGNCFPSCDDSLSAAGSFH